MALLQDSRVPEGESFAFAATGKSKPTHDIHKHLISRRFYLYKVRYQFLPASGFGFFL